MNVPDIFLKCASVPINWFDNETLTNLHILLKLVKTMAAMEQYQNTGMPSFKPLQHVLARYNATIAKTQQLAKK